MNKKGMLGDLLGRIIGVAVMITIGIALFPIIASEITNVEQQCMNNTNGSAYIFNNNSQINDTQSGMEMGCAFFNENSLMKVMLDFIPWFFALAILGLIIQIVWSALRDAGLFERYEHDIENDEDEDEDENEEKIEAEEDTRTDELDETEKDKKRVQERIQEFFKAGEKKKEEEIESKKDIIKDKGIEWGEGMKWGEGVDTEGLKETESSAKHYGEQNKKYEDKMKKFKEKKTVDESELNRSRFD